MLKKYKDFIGIHGLVEAFEEFIKPKGIRDKLEESKKTVAENSRKKKTIEIEKIKKHDIAI